jgi:aspartate--ammonia ligase
MADKKADLAGPGISTFRRWKILPTDYNPLLNRMDTQRGLFEIKRYIEDNLCKELNLQMVQVPLIVDRESGVNDYLDRDGSRRRSSSHSSAQSASRAGRMRRGRGSPSASSA